MRATAFLAALLIVGILGLAGVLDDVLYRRAERLYQAGDFEKASLWSERVLKMNPSHAPARALFTEVQFILGQGKVWPAAVDYGQYMKRDAHTLVEMDIALARAERSGDEREWRKILEYAKWLPDTPDVRKRADRARACLSGSGVSER